MMGNTRSKPYYVAELRKIAFTKAMFEKIRNYATPL